MNNSKKLAVGVKILGMLKNFNKLVVHLFRNYRVLVRVYVCVGVCVSVCLHDSSKRNKPISRKLEYIVVYDNSSDEFDIELCRIKVKVTLGL